mmetsp:Transcript_10923/g.27498  ORF Transcript_10923/g.27498 Transcript_10923/m.27498 type:complete len:336 (-) Transcript_10923:594-1601(-)
MLSLNTGEYYPCRPHHQLIGSFRVMSYNCLAEIYARKFTYTHAWALAWTYRRRNLIREILAYDADILCLQEVQADHFEDHYKPWLERMGYDGVFKSKTREDMGRRGKVDGCATFYKRSMFGLRGKHEVEFNSIARQRMKDSRVLNRVLKGNIGLIVILEVLDGSRLTLCVANTHIFWDPDLSDVKLFQVDCFMQKLEEISAQLAVDVPIILCGDFNSEPSSSVYELINSGAINPDHEDINDPFKILQESRLKHSLHMRSVHSLAGGEPSYTNLTPDYIGTLDYIFYATDRLIVVTGVLEVLDEKTLLGVDNSTAIPSTRWSSDHIALVADFQVLQ